MVVVFVLFDSTQIWCDNLTIEHHPHRFYVKALVGSNTSCKTNRSEYLCSLCTFRPIDSIWLVLPVCVVFFDTNKQKKCRKKKRNCACCQALLVYKVYTCRFWTRTCNYLHYVPLTYLHIICKTPFTRKFYHYYCDIQHNDVAFLY